MACNNYEFSNIIITIKCYAKNEKILNILKPVQDS